MVAAIGESEIQEGEPYGTSLLCFLTCGSVDDGKSTLIGRLLYDTGQVFDDQLRALEIDSRAVGRTGSNLDFALLVDGLIAEREQGITIDVAYRYFTARGRSFIVADTPGHEQYTRNMATGASRSDVAVVLVDARKGVTDQTRRHTCIVHLLGIRNIVLAINKMDLVDFAEERFDEIQRDYLQLSNRLGGLKVTAIPLVAVSGGNVVTHDVAMKWYGGPTLLDYLQTVDPLAGEGDAVFRFPVQIVTRPDATFRGYAGTIASGRVARGDAVVVLPSGLSAVVASVHTSRGERAFAQAGDAITLVLDREVDVSRGSVLVSPINQPELSDQIAATLIWMSREALLPGRTYYIKLATQSASATVTAIKNKLDVTRLEKLAARQLEMNEIGSCNLSFSKPLVLEPYARNHALGAFLLIDRITNETAAAGLVEFGLRRAQNIHWQALDVDAATRASLMGQRPCCVWMTGLSGAGKTTLSNLLDKKLCASGHHSFLLDGDNIRHGLNRDLGFTDADRVENIRRVAEVARLMVDAGLIVIVSFISPFRAERQMARELIGDDRFSEVFVDTPLDVCEIRDAKGLYKKARTGAIINFTGISSPYEAPERPDVRLAEYTKSPADQIDTMLAVLRNLGKL